MREKEGTFWEPVVANRTTGSENEKQAFQVQASFSEANTETIDNGKWIKVSNQKAKAKA